MTLTILPRSSWQFTTQPVKGPAANLPRIVRVVLHYTASKRIPADIPAFLRSIQNDYTVNRGYSIGYNFAVDQQGRAWELRGLDIKCAANRGFNEDSLAILLLVDDADPANPAMLATTRELIAHIRRHAPGASKIVPHGDLMPTGCPGVGVRRQIVAGDFNPSTVIPPTPEPEDPDVKIKTLRARVQGQPGEALVRISMKGFTDPHERDVVLGFEDDAIDYPCSAADYAALARAAVAGD